MAGYLREFVLAKGIRVTNIFGNHTEGGFKLEIKTIANHSEPLKLDLQFFADGSEDAILPDDYTPESSVEDVTSDDEVDTNETESNDIEQTEEQTQEENPTEQLEQQESPTFKIKYNKEEQEISYDDAVPLIQKGMNYDKLQERINQFENDPGLSLLNELAQEAGMTIPDYVEAIRQEREQRELDELIQQNIPEEYAKEMLESRKFRQQLQEEREAAQQKEKENADFKDFFDYFNQVNGRMFDSTKDQIPQEVFDLNAQGMPLKYAYMEHHNKELQAKVQRLTQNQTNKEKAPITGTTVHGSQEVASQDPFEMGFDSIK